MRVGVDREPGRFDVTPCHDADGTWAPGADCGDFPLDPSVARQVGEALALRSFDVGDGSEVQTIRNIIGVGPFPGSPGNVTALDTERLVLLDPFSGSAAIFDATTGDVLPIDPFIVPSDAELFGDGVAICDFGTGSIVLATGPTLADRSTLVEGLAAPTGLAADGDDLYVSSAVTGTVLKVVSNGEVLATPEPATSTVLAGPEGMTVRSGGRLVVVEGATGALQQIDLATGGVTMVASGMSFLPALPGLLPFLGYPTTAPNRARSCAWTPRLTWVRALQTLFRLWV